MKTSKKILISILAVLIVVVLFVVGYVGYVLLSYNRIGDMDLDITTAASNNEVKIGDVYSVSTYNIGFGAYSQDFTFFLDTGYDENGEETCGYYSKAKSKEEVLFNTNGAIDTILDLNVDFALFQEVDTDSTRSYKINQNEMIKQAFTGFDSTFAINFHSAYLPYPLYDMHGIANAGLATLSKYKIQSAKRYEYTISDSLSKLFDLDRCFSEIIVDIEGSDKKLHIVNSHMSAYDKGGVIRAKQIEELNAYMKECQEKGDYVVIGGDYNHDLITYNPNFSYTKDNIPFYVNKKAPDWVSYFYDENGTSEFIDEYSIVTSDNNPTCRNNDMEWEPGKTFTCVVDGYIVSNNIEIVYIENVQTKQGNKRYEGFAYSDHEPVYMQFKLK